MTDRLPVPGEDGWQANSIQGWVDIQITEGPYHEGDAIPERPGLRVAYEKIKSYHYPLYRVITHQHGVVGLIPFRNMRRRPEQSDNQVTGTSYQQLIDELKSTPEEVTA